MRERNTIKTNVYTGTSGYSFKAWQGGFYPSELATHQWLEYYASQLPSVEINNTFYRMPKRHVVEAWRECVPATFRFVIKASRRITHQQRLRDCVDTTNYLTQKTNLLGPKLGAVLFQLPPNLRADVEQLKNFAATLPLDYPAVFEFRHPSWDDPKVNACLREFGHARVVTHDKGPLPSRLIKSDLTYLRLRAENYDDKDLQVIAERVKGTGATSAYVFFKHEEDALGPTLAQRMIRFASRQDARKPQPPKAAPRKATGRSKRSNAV